jgi:multidrug efflux pump subunit AcrA (membrane-fusion protein)
MGAQRKERCSFTLSRESVEYLEREQQQRKAPSTSSVLDEILRENKLALEKRQFEAAMTSYYDTISDQERAENRAWGAFAESQIKGE